MTDDELIDIIDTKDIFGLSTVEGESSIVTILELINEIYTRRKIINK